MSNITSNIIKERHNTIKNRINEYIKIAIENTILRMNITIVQLPSISSDHIIDYEYEYIYKNGQYYDSNAGMVILVIVKNDQSKKNLESYLIGCDLLKPFKPEVKESSSILGSFRTKYSLSNDYSTKGSSIPFFIDYELLKNNSELLECYNKMCQKTFTEKYISEIENKLIQTAKDEQTRCYHDCKFADVAFEYLTRKKIFDVTITIGKDRLYFEWES